jgi:uncharacterized protein (DUF58 family)
MDITIQRRITGLLAGDNRSSALGLGTELAQVRPYEPGDDVRQIDWNVTARTTQPHVRVQVADRVLTTWLLLDTSPSMAFGTADRRKADVAEGVALAIGHIATRRGNRLGICTFGDSRARVWPPVGGRPGMLNLFVALQQPEQAQATGPTSLGATLRDVNAMAGVSKLVVIVSDFRGPRDWSRSMIELAGRDAVIAVEVRDPREQELPNVGELWLVDPETGRQLRVDTSRRSTRERFAEVAATERRQLADELRRIGCRHVVLSTAGDWLRPLATFLTRKGDLR